MGRDAIAEELLLVRCQLGERAAYDALVHAHADPLTRHVRRLAGAQAADDLTQEIWLRAFRGIARLRDGTHFRPWLFGIAHHVVMDHFRLRHAMTEELREDIPGPMPNEDEEIAATLDTQLAELPPIERETLTLFYLEELPLSDIAAIQAVPTGTVKSRLFRARGLLRRALRPEGKSP